MYTYVTQAGDAYHPESIATTKPHTYPTLPKVFPPLIVLGVCMCLLKTFKILSMYIWKVMLQK